MSFKAVLFINDEKRNILNAKQLFYRFSDENYRPTSKSVGGRLEFVIESTANDSFFYENMFSPTERCKGELVFYKRDGLSTLFKMEFANAQILSLRENFNAYNNMPLHMTVSIGWGIMRMKGVIIEEKWNPYNPFIKVKETVREEDEKSITQYFITDVNGDELESYKAGDTIVLNVETENRIGDTMTINLTDKTHDFKYNGQILKDDIIKDYVISSNSEKIELEVFNQTTQN